MPTPIAIVFFLLSAGSSGGSGGLPAVNWAQTHEALDGHLAFVRLTDGIWQIWKLDLASGQERQITTTLFDKRYPEWDEAGNLYFRNNNDEIFRISTRAGAVARPYRPEDWPALDPVAGPNDSGIVFVRLRTDIADASALYWVELGGGDTVRLLTPGPGLRMHPDWNRGGLALAYVNSIQGSRSEIRRVGLDGGPSISLVGDDAKNLHPAFSPTTDDLAYVSNRSGTFDIWLKPSTGDDLQLTDSDVMETKPSWSPDGEKLAFSAFRGGRFEIWVMNADGSAPRPLLSGSSDVRDPAWR